MNIRRIDGKFGSVNELSEYVYGIIDEHGDKVGGWPLVLEYGYELNGMMNEVRKDMAFDGYKVKERLLWSIRHDDRGLNVVGDGLGIYERGLRVVLDGFRDGRDICKYDDSMEMVREIFLEVGLDDGGLMEWYNGIIGGWFVDGKEKNRREEIKRRALLKLTDEEREILGI